MHIFFTSPVHGNTSNNSISYNGILKGKKFYIKNLSSYHIEIKTKQKRFGPKPLYSKEFRKIFPKYFISKLDLKAISFP